jgi:hypothetical protein
MGGYLYYDRFSYSSLRERMVDLIILKDRIRRNARKFLTLIRNISGMRYALAPRHVKLHGYLANNNILPRTRRAELVAMIVASLPADEQRQEREHYTQLLDACPSTVSVDPQMGFKRLDTSYHLAPDCIADTHARIEHHKAGVGKQMNFKSYLIETTSLKDYSPDNPCFQLATSPDVLGTVARYLGSCPVLWNITALYSPPLTSSKKEFEGSQLWHVDKEDISNLKLWLLCSEVTPSSGPTVVLPAKYSDQVAAKLGSAASERIRNESYFEPFRSNIMSLMGSKGDMFFTDTAKCYHYGSRIRLGIERRVLMIHYVTRHSVHFAPGKKRRHDRLHPHIRDAWRMLPESTRAVLRAYHR